jgi:hypothetical protein
MTSPQYPYPLNRAGFAPHSHIPLFLVSSVKGVRQRDTCVLYGIWLH